MVRYPIGIGGGGEQIYNVQYPVHIRSLTFYDYTHTFHQVL